MTNPYDTFRAHLLYWNQRLKDKDPRDQIMQIGAEYGEFLNEWETHHGTNPRKPQTDRNSELSIELSDIIITSFIAMEMLGFHPNNVFDRMRIVTLRMQAWDDQNPITKSVWKTSIGSETETDTKKKQCDDCGLFFNKVSYNPSTNKKVCEPCYKIWHEKARQV